jgi:hypothetical protein
MIFSQSVGLPWNLLLALVSVLVSCILVFDADWMWKLARGRHLPVKPPMFGGVVAAAGMRQKIKYLALFGLVLAPLMMSRFMALPTRMPHGDWVWMGLIALLSPALLLAEVRGWKHLGTGLAVLLCAALLFPYAAAGWIGLTRYLVIEALFWSIAALLSIAVLTHQKVLGRPPRSRSGQIVRLIAGSTGAVAIMAVTFWPLMGSS